MVGCLFIYCSYLFKDVNFSFGLNGQFREYLSKELQILGCITFNIAKVKNSMKTWLLYKSVILNKYLWEIYQNKNDEHEDDFVKYLQCWAMCLYVCLSVRPLPLQFFLCRSYWNANHSLYDKITYMYFFYYLNWIVGSSWGITNRWICIVMKLLILYIRPKQGGWPPFMWFVSVSVVELAEVGTFLITFSWTCSVSIMNVLIYTFLTSQPGLHKGGLVRSANFIFCR